MAKRTIEMHYHPAIKKVKFYNDKGVRIQSYRLQQLEDSQFVLQEQGDDFFKTVSAALDGIKEIEIKFFGTQVDYEDFKGMVDYFNEHNNNNNNALNFSCVQSSVLLGMNEMYSEVEKFGEKAVNILKARIRDFENNDSDNEIRKNFKSALDKHTDDIKSKIESLKSTGINICFVGTYSSGKSSLINAIIGERILPEDDESKTAKFYILDAPADDESLGIFFQLDGVDTEVKWNGSSLELDHNLGTHDFRNEIQACLTDNKSKLRHEQFYALLDLINSNRSIGIKINIKYPLSAINTDAMSFTIYDTPGTGSNARLHGIILEEALKEQSHSIVVFVGGVTKLEGEGNSLLLEMLNGNNKNSIDLDRSLFVINRSDTTTKSKLKDYQTETIRIISKSPFESDEESNIIEETKISLKDKKLFFTSAAQACAAIAMKNGYATDDDSEYWDGLKKYPFYMFNRYGNSQVTTERMINAALLASETASNEYDKAYIDVGLYSLICAIREYGEKYAMATKVNALVSTVKDVLNELSVEAENKKRICNDKIEELENDIRTIKDEIDIAINKEYESRCPKKGDVGYDIDEGIRQELGISPEAIKDLQDEIIKDVISIFKNDKGKLKKKTKDNKVNTPAISDIVNEKLNAYIDKLNDAQSKVLRDAQKSFKVAIIKAIESSSNLTDTAKEYLKKGLPDYDKYDDVNYIDDIKERISKIAHRKHFLWWSWKVVYIDELRDEIDNKVAECLSKNTEEFVDYYCNNLEKILTLVKDCFEHNKENFFCTILQLKENRELVLKIASELEDTAEQLQTQIKEFDSIVWKNRG